MASFPQTWKLELRHRLLTNGLSGVSIHISDLWSSGQFISLHKSGQCGNSKFYRWGFVIWFQGGHLTPLYLKKGGKSVILLFLPKFQKKGSTSQPEQQPEPIL